MPKRKKRSSSARPRSNNIQRSGVSAPSAERKRGTGEPVETGRRPRGRGFLIAAALFAVLVVVFAAVQYERNRASSEAARPASEPVAAKAAAADYVGGKACTECHAKETEAWRGSDHDLAMQIA